MPRPTIAPLTLDRVCIIWRNDPNDFRAINTLTYQGGIIRTYEPDGIDGRAGDVPVLTTDADISEHLRTKFGSDNSLAIPVRTAMRLFGWKREDFADL